jgi:hypothetical protein
MPDTSSDALSLTLPVASKSRLRIRKPKKPDVWTMIYGVFATVEFWGAVGSLSEGELFEGLLGALLAAGFGTMTWESYKGRRPTGYRFGWPSRTPFWPWGFVNGLMWFSWILLLVQIATAL